MRRFVLAWKKRGLERSLGSRIVTYADDLVTLCKHGKAEEALEWMRKIMGKLKLTVNEEKTRICKVPEGEFDFLGYTFGRRYSAITGKARITLWPSKKSIRRLVEKIHALPHGWVEDRDLIPRAAKLVEVLPLPYRHLINAIFWNGERFKRFCTLQLFRYGDDSDPVGCLLNAVTLAESMREACKTNGDASVSMCILLGLLDNAGKAGEYYRSEGGRWAPTSSGKLLWHKAILLDWISEARARWNVRFPEKLYMALIHSLISSSSIPEGIGGKEPQLPEARLLSETTRPTDDFDEQVRRIAMKQAQWRQYAIQNGIPYPIYRAMKERGL